MSGVPIIGKVFKEIEKGVKHVIKEIDKNPVLKAVVIAAAVYFTYSAAASYFSESQAVMLAKQTSVFGAEGITLTGEALASNAAASGAVAAEAAQAAKAMQAAQQASEAANLASNAQPVGGNGAGTEITKNVVKDEVINKGASSGIGGWVEANPVQATLLGQAGIGAASGYAAGEEDKNARNDRRAEEERAREERLNRGTFGFDRNGNYGGASNGLVSSAMQGAQQPIAQPATNAPIIASQQAAQIAPQQVTPIAAPTVAIQRADLPKLKPRG